MDFTRKIRVPTSQTIIPTWLNPAIPLRLFDKPASKKDPARVEITRQIGGGFRWEYGDATPLRSFEAGSETKCTHTPASKPLSEPTPYTTHSYTKYIYILEKMKRSRKFSNNMIRFE